MIAVGNEAQLRWNGTTVARARDISLDISKDALESTTLGVKNRTYVPGLRSATGSCTLMFDANDEVSETFLNTITGNNSLNPDGAITLNFAPNGGRFILDIIMTSVGITAAADSLITVSVNFQVTGAIPTAGF
jgi:hypothetical protein